MNKDVELSNEIDQHDTSVGQRKNRVPYRNRTHDLLSGVLEVMDRSIPVRDSDSFFFAPPPCHVDQFTFHNFGFDTRSTVNKTSHSLIIKMVALNVIAMFIIFY